MRVMRVFTIVLINYLSDFIYFYVTIHCYHCISPNPYNCAWAVGELGVCAYLQDEVVSRVLW